MHVQVRFVETESDKLINCGIGSLKKAYRPVKADKPTKNRV